MNKGKVTCEKLKAIRREVAEKLGMNDGNFSRKLRKELSSEEKAKIKAIIAELKGVSE